MAFKVKNKIVKKNIDSRITLDAKYNEQLININNNKNKIKIKQSKLNELKVTVVIKKLYFRFFFKKKSIKGRMLINSPMLAT